MAFNKKKKRRMIVDGQLYFWSANGNDGWIDLWIMAHVPCGQKLSCYFAYHQDFIPHSEGGYSTINQFIVTPYIVRQVILHGLQHGWKPLEPGPDLKLRHLDDQIDLRLDQNREHAIKAGVSVKKWIE